MKIKITEQARLQTQTKFYELQKIARQIERVYNMGEHQRNPQNLELNDYIEYLINEFNEKRKALDINLNLYMQFLEQEKKDKGE